MAKANSYRNTHTHTLQSLMPFRGVKGLHLAGMFDVMNTLSNSKSCVPLSSRKGIHLGLYVGDDIMGCSCHMTRGHWSFTQFKSCVLDNAMCIVGGQKERVQMKHTRTPELVESHYVL